MSDKTKIFNVRLQLGNWVATVPIKHYTAQAAHALALEHLNKIAVDEVGATLEPGSITDARYIEAAREKYESEGSIEIDESAKVSRGDDPGAYVAAWLWVYDNEVNPESEAA